MFKKIYNKIRRYRIIKEYRLYKNDYMFTGGGFSTEELEKQFYRNND